MLRVNTTLTELNMSNNEFGGWFKNGTWGHFTATPEGPAALAAGLADSTSVTQVDVSQNGLSAKGGKALADSLKINTTITQVS